MNRFIINLCSWPGNKSKSSASERDTGHTGQFRVNNQGRDIGARDKVFAVKQWFLLINPYQ
jgi:hypothetical protein